MREGGAMALVPWPCEEEKRERKSKGGVSPLGLQREKKREGGIEGREEAGGHAMPM
jgi:hypothetical protein